MDDAALVARVIAECPSRLARESPECRLPGWCPSSLTPSHLSLIVRTPMSIPLSIHKLSGRTCAEVQATDRWALRGEIFGSTVECDPALRAEIFDSMLKCDADFPFHASWFLELIKFTPICSQGSSAMCTVVFPSAEIDHSRNGWEWNRSQWNRVEQPNVQEEENIVIGRWSDPGTLLVGFYLASTLEQQTSLAKCISKLTCTSLSDYFPAVATIFSSPRFTVVNCLKGFAYKGVEHDTTLWHLLLENRKWWNYTAFTKIFQVLLSREDLDFSHSGWSWAKGDTVSAAELCFFEWCGVASQAANRQLWVDPATLRLCLLSICLHVQRKHATPKDIIVQAAKQLNDLIANERLFVKKQKVLKKQLLQDMELLGSGELIALPGFLKSEDLLAVASLIKQ